MNGHSLPHVGIVALWLECVSAWDSLLPSSYRKVCNGRKEWCSSCIDAPCNFLVGLLQCIKKLLQRLVKGFAQRFDKKIRLLLSSLSSLSELKTWWQGYLQNNLFCFCLSHLTPNTVGHKAFLALLIQLTMDSNDAYRSFYIDILQKLDGLWNKCIHLLIEHPMF